MEIAQGTYQHDSAKKPFFTLRKSTNGVQGASNTKVHLGFLNPLGDKYVILSRFLPEIGKIETRHLALLPDIDPDRPRIVSHSMYEELRETNISPIFLTLSLHIAKKYRQQSIHGEEVIVAVDESARALLPRQIYLRVETHDGCVAPVEVQMYQGESVISIIHLKNAMVNGRLRPFRIYITSRGKTDSISVDTWGLMDNKQEFFTAAGLSRGNISMPLIHSRVTCPKEICNEP